MKGAIEDNLEAAIDIFSKSISGNKLTDQQLDILTNIPVVKNITAIARFYRSIREASTVKKIVKFIETLQKGNLDKECYERLKKKYGDEKILEEVLFRIDRMRSVAHVKIQAHLYRALLEEKITWDRFIQICDAVEQLSVVDIDKETGLGNPGSSFISSGLAYLYYNNDVPPRIARNGRFYNDFWNYGLEPYQKEVNNESTI